jgi:CheY-like chemotaxis protein
MPTILVVDDEKLFRDRVCEYLQGLGASVKTACDGLEALKLIKEEAPDLVLSDINMPGLDGIKLGWALKRNPATRRAVLVYLTASSRPDHVLEGVNLGARHFIAKPVDREQLLAKVRPILNALQRR